MARKLIAGNWKMNGLRAAIAEAEAVADGIGRHNSDAACLICPPATLIAPMAAAVSGTSLQVGGQGCHANENGAHTGDVSAEMLRDAGASYVIVGHSERRADHGESDSDVAAQANAAFRADITPIICIGESLAQREAGETLAVVTRQLDSSLPEACATQSFVVAYEPIWAIGTGLTPTSAQIGEVHAALRTYLKQRFPAQADATPLLYGGSMKPGNAAEILAIGDVDGGLIGGASLNAADLLSIYAAAG